MSPSMTADSAQVRAGNLLDEISSIIGETNIGDASQFAIDDVVPGMVASPGSVEEVAGILRLASERDLIVVPAGGMTKQGIGAIPERIDILLRTNRLNKVEHYDAGDLTFGAGAGMTIAEIQQILAANSQFLPLDPMLPERATIGGVLACNAHGPMKSGFGGVRDYCIGVHFVTADAKVAKGGGRVVKNVAGYDLMKLMIGSFGTLGIITSANFKVFPSPTQTKTFVCEFASIAEAIVFRDRIIASPLQPMCIEIASPRAQEYLQGPVTPRDPDHYSPAARFAQCSTWNIVVRASGSDSVLSRYRRELGSAVTREIAHEEEKQLWKWISNFQPAVIERHRNAMVMQVSVSMSAVRAALEAAEQSAVENNLLCASIGRAAAGALVFAFMPLAVDPPSAMQFANTASSLRGRLPKDASAIVLHCPKEAKHHFNIWGSTPTDLQTMRGIRAAMDPKGILNRGRFLV
ncbi:MAG: linked oxidase domain protein [Acidobacteriaceae bacterium]|nr:linked oxidase domain protein [Acidobacteriaceae bacterium]